MTQVYLPKKINTFFTPGFRQCAHDWLIKSAGFKMLQSAIPALLQCECDDAAPENASAPEFEQQIQCLYKNINGLKNINRIEMIYFEPGVGLQLSCELRFFKKNDSKPFAVWKPTVTLEGAFVGMSFSNDFVTITC